MSAGVLVAGIGNIFSSDDGFGPEVVRRLAAPGSAPLQPDARLVDYGIRGLHLLYDLLDGWEALVLIDALPGRGRPGQTVVLQVGPDDLTAPGGSVDPHAMSPVAVLAGLADLGGRLPPTYLVGAHPVRLDDGIGLSDAMAPAVAEAEAAVRELLTTRPWRSADDPASRPAGASRAG